MKYLRRALKYFLQICILFVVIIGALMLTGMVSKDVAVAFQKGWTSIGYIAAIFLVMSFAYPFFGYGKRRIRAAGEPAEHREAILDAMDVRGYKLVWEKEGEYRFCLKSPVARLFRLFEDAVTISPVLGGFEAEGLIRDLARVVASIDHKINYNDN